jgi:hypothetical protein
MRCSNPELQNQNTRNRFSCGGKAQAVAVISFTLPHTSVLNIFSTRLRFPLDKPEIQPIMWTKVGQSG